MKLLQETIALLLTLFYIMPLPATEIYKWKDANGKIHYTDKPLQGNDVTKEKVVLSNLSSIQSNQSSVAKANDIYKRSLASAKKSIQTSQVATKKKEFSDTFIKEEIRRCKDRLEVDCKKEDIIRAIKKQQYDNSPSGIRENRLKAQAERNRQRLYWEDQRARMCASGVTC